MSGEIFQNCYLIKSTDELPPKFRKYFFENNNTKILLLAVDFDLSGRVDIDQDTQFDFILQFLKKQKMIPQLEAVVLIITKWDMSPDQSEEAAKQFLDNKYPSLINLCREYNEMFDLKLYIYTFSLVLFHNEYYYEYDERDSKKMFNLLNLFSPYQNVRKKRNPFLPF